MDRSQPRILLNAHPVCVRVPASCSVERDLRVVVVLGDSDENERYPRKEKGVCSSAAASSSAASAAAVPAAAASAAAASASAARLASSSAASAAKALDGRPAPRSHAEPVSRRLDFVYLFYAEVTDRRGHRPNQNVPKVLAREA